MAGRQTNIYVQLLNFKWYLKAVCLYNRRMILNTCVTFGIIGKQWLWQSLDMIVWGNPDIHFLIADKTHVDFTQTWRAHRQRQKIFTSAVLVRVLDLSHSISVASYAKLRSVKFCRSTWQRPLVGHLSLPNMLTPGFSKDLIWQLNSATKA